MDNKKIFDVTPPKTAESIEAAKSARKIMLNDPALKQDSSASPDIETAPSTPEKNLVPHQELTVSPLTDEPKTDAKTAPEISSSEDKKASVADEPKTEEIPAETANDEPETDEEAEIPKKDVVTDEPEKAEEVEDKQEPIKELASFDSIIPDDSQRATATAKDAMQSPTMYDTKAYYVPIGNSKHRHGHVFGTVIAGLIVAALAVGAVIAAGTFL